MVGREAAFVGCLGDLNSRAEESGLAFRLESTRDPGAPVSFRSVTCGEIRFEFWRQEGEALLSEPRRLDRYHFVFPVRANGLVRSGTREWNVEAGRHALGLSPECAHETTQAAGWRDFSVAIPVESLRLHWGALAHSEAVTPIEFPARIDLTTRGGARFARLVEFMAREAQREDGLMHAPASCARLTETFRTVLLTQLPHSHRGLLRVEAEDPGPRVVGRAEEFMAEHFGRPIRMTEVAACAGVSLRSLQEAFHRHRPYAPLEFLKRRRLERARARLRTEPATSVTSIALDCGFAHASHFGAAYRQLFDETPSETRRSARIR